MFVENIKRTFIAGEDLAARRRVRVRADTEAVAEKQTLLPDAPATAGTWTLTYDGHTTAAIDHDAAVGAVEDALELLPNITAGDVVVGGDSLDTDPVVGGMTFTFLATLGDVNMLDFDFSGLTGPAQAGSTMTETVKGVLAGPVVLAGIDETCIGVTEYEAAADEKVAVRLKNAGGSFEVTAEGIIAVGADCKGAASGRLVTGALANDKTGDEAVAIEASTATGDLVEVIFKSDKMTAGGA